MAVARKHSASRTWFRRGVVVVVVVFAALVAYLLLIRPSGPEPPGDGAVTAPPSPKPPTQPAASAGPIKGPYTTANLDVPPVPDPVVEGTDADVVAAKLRIPKHKWQKQRVDAIRSESVRECIANLGNFDDQHLAETSLPGAKACTAAAQSIIVTRLSRVRRLLEDGRRDPDSVIGPFRAAFAQGLDEWPKARQEFMDAFNRAEAEGVGFTRSEPIPYDTLRTRSLAATYVLAELGDHQSLPLMVRCFELNLDPKKMTAPSPPAVTLYAMHQLMLSYPEASLTDQSRRVRQEYLAAAAEVFAEPKKVGVTKWHADYAESDPRILMGDPKKGVLQDQPMMMMRIYPVRYLNGQDYTDSMWVPSEASLKLFEKVKNFTELTFPADK